MIKKIAIFSFIFFYSITIAHSQPAVIDSLKLLIKNGVADTLKVNHLNRLSRIYQAKGSYDNAKSHADSALYIAKKLGYQKGIISAYNNIGTVHYYQGNFDKALNSYFVALKMCEHLSESSGALKTTYDKEIANLYNNIGMVYQVLNKNKEALKHYQKSVGIREKIGNKNDISDSYSNIGIVYSQMGNFEESDRSFKKSLALKIELKNQDGISRAYNNIGSNMLSYGGSYLQEGNNAKAIKYFKTAQANFIAALKIQEKTEDYRSIALSYANLGITHTFLEEYKMAGQWFDKALMLSKEIGEKNLTKDIYNELSGLNEKAGNYKEALYYEQQSELYKDSILNESTSKNITEMQTKYETEKKEQQISLLNKEGEIKELSIKKQQTIIYAIVAGLLLVVVFTVFVFRALSVTKKQKHIIGIQKEIVEKKSEELSTKNKQIADSINYAQNIQQTMLPSETKFKELFSDSFVFFQPKDVVSGDFYWLQQLTNNNNETLVMLAVIDCTGHGVPGAFVSLMAYNFLEKVVNEHRVYNPSEILQELNKEVIEVLRKDEQLGSTKYGMDMALVSWNKTTGNVIYAGARNPLYIVSENKLTQIEANRMSIGSSADYSFVQHEVNLKKDDMLYLFTDGFADQKGGTEGKKFYYPPFRNLLESVSEKAAEKQKTIINDTFLNWKGSHHQIDDVSVVGIKINAV